MKHPPQPISLAKRTRLFGCRMHASPNFGRSTSRIQRLQMPLRRQRRPCPAQRRGADMACHRRSRKRAFPFPHRARRRSHWEGSGGSEESVRAAAVPRAPVQRHPIAAVGANGFHRHQGIDGSQAHLRGGCGEHRGPALHKSHSRRIAPGQRAYDLRSV